MNFQTIYDILAPASPPIIPISTILVLTSVLVFAGLIWISLRHKSSRTLTISVAIVYSLCLVVALSVPDTPRYNTAQLVLKNGTYLVAEGAISDFHPQVLGGRKVEEFTVNNVTFRYNNADLSNPGFKASGEANGPIRDGALVRVYYYYDESRAQNIILKLDVAQATVSATTVPTSLATPTR